MKSKKILMMMLMALFSLSSCHDDTDMPTPSATHWTVSLVTSDDDSRHDPSLLSRYAAYESIIVSIIGLTDDTRTIAVTSDADWLTLRRDTLAADGIVTFTTTDNRTDQRRTATLTFADADHPELTGTLTLSQLSAADQDSNGDPYRQRCFRELLEGFLQPSGFGVRGGFGGFFRQGTGEQPGEHDRSLQ